MYQGSIQLGHSREEALLSAGTDLQMSFLRYQLFWDTDGPFLAMFDHYKKNTVSVSFPQVWWLEKIKFQNLDLDCKLSVRPRDCEGKEEKDEDLQQEVE